MDTRRFLTAVGVLVGTAVIFAFGFGVWLSAIVAVPALCVVGLTAFSSWRTLDAFVDRTFEAVQLDAESVPDAVRQHFEEVGEELEGRGFRHAGARRSPLGKDGAAEFSAAWTSADGAYVVTSTAYHSPRRAGVVANPFITVSTWHNDGRAIETTTLSYSPVLWELSDVEIVSLPGCGLDLLLDLHRARLERAMPGLSADVVDFRSVDAMSGATTVQKRLCASLLAEGLLGTDGRGRYKPTRRGRMRTMLAYTWPIIAVRRVVERRRVDKLLRRIGLLNTSPARITHWALAISGLVAIAIALSFPGGLGSSSLAWVSMYVMALVMSKPEREPGYAAILGGSAMLSLLVVIAFFAPGPAYGIHAPLVLSVVGLFTAGTMALYRGWGGISYLHTLALRISSER